MSSIEKALIVYCTTVSFFCLALLLCVIKLQNAMIDLNKNQQILEENIEEVDNFNIKMWENQIEINKSVLGIEYETY